MVEREEEEEGSRWNSEAEAEAEEERATGAWQNLLRKYHQDAAFVSSQEQRGEKPVTRFGAGVGVGRRGVGG